MKERVFKKGSVVFVFKSNSPAISKAGIHFKLCGYRGERLTISPYGEAVPKMYEYPGIPHVDIAPSVIAVKKKEAPKIEALFHEFKVSYIKIVPKRVEKSSGVSP